MTKELPAGSTLSQYRIVERAARAEGAKCLLRLRQNLLTKTNA